MAAVTGTPGLSALLAWPTDHLTEAADHWESVGDRSYGVAHGVWSDALTVDWDGEAADALRTDTHADLMTTSGVVDQLQAAATTARSGASELDAARSQLRYAVDDAHSAGFEVGEDLSVADRMAGGSAAQLAGRQAAAEAHAANIGGRAAQLVSVDAQVAARVTAAVAGVGNTFPPSAVRQRPDSGRRQPHVQTRLRQTARQARGHDRSRSTSRVVGSQRRAQCVERSMRTHIHLADREGGIRLRMADRQLTRTGRQQSGPVCMTSRCPSKAKNPSSIPRLPGAISSASTDNGVAAHGQERVEGERRARTAAISTFRRRQASDGTTDVCVGSVRRHCTLRGQRCENYLE